MPGTYAPNANPRAKYQLIAEKYRKLIDHGLLKPHDRLPTIDEIADEEGVTRSTAHKAMLRLTAEGYTCSESSGTYVLMGGTDRMYAAVTDLFNSLDALDEHLHPMRGDIVQGAHGTIERNTDTGRWEWKGVV